MKNKLDIKATLLEQRALFASELKKHTGHSSIIELSQERTEEREKAKLLIDKLQQEVKLYRVKYEFTEIKTAISAASTQAVDSDMIFKLLAKDAVIDDAGAVTINDFPVQQAVNDLLSDKPFLAKASINQGSGAGGSHFIHSTNPWKKEQFNLTEQIDVTKNQPKRAKQMKEQAT